MCQPKYSFQSDNSQEVGDAAAYAGVMTSLGFPAAEHLLAPDSPFSAETGEPLPSGSIRSATTGELIPVFAKKGETAEHARSRVQARHR